MGALIQTAMIIDDDPDLGELLASILENRKILTLTVQSLPEAAQFLTYLKPTIIFLDNSFPEGLGVNFIRHIKTTDDEIKVIMMTGDSEKWIEDKAVEEGAFFLKKPFNKTVINNVLDQLNFRKHNDSNG